MEKSLVVFCLLDDGGGGFAVKGENGLFSQPEALGLSSRGM